MKVVYENATNNDDPLVREFHFQGGANVRYAGKTYNDVTNLTLKVKRRTKVYADQPLSKLSRH